MRGCMIELPGGRRVNVYDDPRRFAELIDEYMGWDAMAWFNDLIDEYESEVERLEGEVAALERDDL